MGVFDLENTEFVDSTPETGTSTEVTPAEEGHVENENTETQAPETTETVQDEQHQENTQNVETAENETGSESKATQTVESNIREAKLLANKYKTMGGLINGVLEAAKILGEKVELNDINSTEEMEQRYLTYQQRISKGEAKHVTFGDTNPENEKTPETIRKAVDEQRTVIDTELQKIIETSNKTLKELATPSEDEDEDFEERFAEDPKRALAEHDAKREARLRKEFEAKMNLEGAKMMGTFAPVIQKFQAEERKAADTQAWGQAVGNLRKAISEHGANDLDDKLPAIIKYLDSNPDMYEIVNASPNTPGVREKVLSIAYRDIKLNEQLSQFAKEKSKQDSEAIQNSKPGLKMQNGVGGGATSTPKKTNELAKYFGDSPESTGVFG
jgi:hypothetical protein